MARNLLVKHLATILKGSIRGTYNVATNLQEHGNGKLRSELVRASNVGQRRPGSNVLALLSDRRSIVTSDGLKNDSA